MPTVRAAPDLSTTLVTFALILGSGLAPGCHEDQEELDVRCTETEVSGDTYCVYQDRPITETGYECPVHLPQPVPVEGGTVCTKDGGIPDEDRKVLRRRFDFEGGALSDTGRPGDGGTADTGTDATDATFDDTGTTDTDEPGPGDTTGDGSIDAASCGPAQTCPPATAPRTPTYRCHTPASPTVGDPVELTMYGEYFSVQPNGFVEISTNTGFSTEVEVQSRCRVTVSMPDTVWTTRSSFTVTLSNQAGDVSFDVQGQ